MLLPAVNVADMGRISAERDAKAPVIKKQTVILVGVGLLNSLVTKILAV